MSFLDSVTGAVGELTGGSQNTFAGKLLSSKTKGTDPLKPDFEGLVITEFQDGAEIDKTQIMLQGNFMPLIPFEFGREQKILKEHYPGNGEPSLQVMGSSEHDVTIKGRFKAKRFKSEEMKLICVEFQKAIDEMVERGNIVRMQLGEWRRYGVLSEGKFKLNRLTDIEYEVTMVVTGDTYPSNIVNIASEEDDPAPANLELIAKANEAMAAMQAWPDSMPRSISDNLNGIISAVAGVVTSVNNAINSLVTEAENIRAAGQRAEGVIKNARSSIASYQRRLSVFGTTMPSLREKYGVAKGTTETTKNQIYLANARTSMAAMSSQLAILQAIAARYANSTPLRVHRIKDGDTLQKISMLYYRTPDNWQKIMSHNNLQSTELAGVQTLEIPR